MHVEIFIVFESKSFVISYVTQINPYTANVDNTLSS